MRLQVVIQQTLPDLRKMRHQGEEQRARQFFTPTISQNRERLLQADIAQAFFEQMVELARQHDLLSDEQFTVDGTLIEAWAGQKSFKKKQGASPKPPADDAGNPSMDFRGEKRTNDTHASTTDRDARLFKKTQGQEAKLGYLGHLWAESRNGSAVSTRLTLATGHGGTGGAAGHGRGDSRGEAGHPGSGQELRHA